MSGSHSPCLFGTLWRVKSVKNCIFCFAESVPRSTTTPDENSILQQVVVILATYFVFPRTGNRLQFWQHPRAQGCCRWPCRVAAVPRLAARLAAAPWGEAVPQCERYPVLWPGAHCWPTANRRLLLFLPFSKFKPYYMTVIANSSFLRFLDELQLTFYFVPCFECREDWSWQDQGSAHEALALYSFLLHFRK